jgi:outer membrane immunogenic protein
MKTLLAVGVAIGIFSAPAFAADMPANAPSPSVVPALNWTGCYMGVEGGGASGHTSHTSTSAGTTGRTLASGDVNGDPAGGTIGCNYQTGGLVFGVEGDLSWANYTGAHHNVAPFIPSIVQTTSTHRLETFRGRVGYAVDRSLWYITGGLAYSDIEASASLPAGLPTLLSHDVTGWTFGGGVEWALPDPHWSVKAEYLYADFRKTHFALDTASGNFFAGDDVRLDENIVRVGLNYRFGWVGSK